MDGLWEKISSYNIFNNLFPGALYIYFLERATHVILSGNDIVKSVVLYYFVGLVVGRLGSLVFEPILKFIRVIKFSPYNEYISACVIDSKIEMLQEVANMYRTLFTVSIMLFLSFIFMTHITGVEYKVARYLSLFLALLFIVSYIKQVRFIVKRIDKAKKKLP